MVAWLSDWLRDIIAVILLAVFVELLLPNKAMQRYARLVVGLFILLTILSPILKLIQSDIGAKLDEGMEKWSKTAMAGDMQMSGLNQIKQDAEAMSKKRNLEAARLMEQTLEASIKNELLERTAAPVAEVDAMLKWVTVSGNQTPFISQITVTLKAIDQKNQSSKDGSSVEAVQPVVVDVEIPLFDDRGSVAVGEEDEGSLDVDGSKQQEKVDGQVGQDGQWSRADPAISAAVSSLIVKGWGVDEKQIIVRQPADQQKDK